jgi:hypothetical protein
MSQPQLPPTTPVNAIAPLGGIEAAASIFNSQHTECVHLFILIFVDHVATSASSNHPR